MDYTGLLLRWFHILPAVVLAGGVFFMRWPLAPATGELDDGVRENLRQAIRRRWAIVVMVTSALLLVTGLFNAFWNIDGHWGEKPVGHAYHAMVGIKLLLALALMMISSLLAGRSALADKLKERATFWMNVNVALAIAIILLGGVMKLTPREPAEPQSGLTSVTISTGK